MSDVIKIVPKTSRQERVDEFTERLSELLEEYEDVGEAEMMVILDLTALTMKMGFIEFEE